MFKDFDDLPYEQGWRERHREMVRARLHVASDSELAEELRIPTTNHVESREMTVREALARILERKTWP